MSSVNLLTMSETTPFERKWLTVMPTYVLLFCSLIWHSKTGLALKYDAPEDCQWITKSESTQEVSLLCKLRTINSEFDHTNFSAIPADHTSHIRIECNEVLFYQSSLENQTFSHLSKLKSLEMEYCKLGKLPAGTLQGLNELRNLTIRTYNTDWAAMSLEIGAKSFDQLRQLERLDLSANNIWTFPDRLFCQLTNLKSLNVSKNRLQDISDLGFREADNEQRMDPCRLEMAFLDASRNNFVLMPSRGLSYLPQLKEVYLQGNEISMVADKALSGLKALKIFHVANNKIVALPPELFRDSTEIKEVYLQNNSLSVLAPGLFANLSHLLALDLSRNQLTSTWINANTFVGLIRLVVLNLSFNKIAEIDPSVFKDLYSLQILNLDYNQIETIPPNTFAAMNNLDTLVLSYNKLTYLDSFALNGPYVLSLLSIDNNAIDNLHEDAFRNCSSLKDLNLNGNRLTEIPKALQSLRLLRTLDLGENAITLSEKLTLGTLNNLYGLRLIGNRITNITKGAFHFLPALKILNLARNHIQGIEQDAFEQNSNLQAIRLDSNYLTEISGLFAELPNLIWLNISDNQVKWFDFAVIPRGLQWLDLHKNNIEEIGNYFKLEGELKLQTLDLSFNKIKIIGSTSIPDSVELVFLNDNLISNVEPHTFLKKENLTRVDLYANQIVSMDLNALRLPPVDPMKSLPEFYIGGNPFQCDCTMEWLQRINKLDHLRQHPKVMDLESIYCKLLYNRDKTYVPLVEAETSQFLCTYKAFCFALCHCCDFDACDCEMTCPTNCTCYHDQSWTANIAECSNIGYDQIPNRLPMYATEVYLDGNSLVQLSSHAFIGRKNLGVLFLNNSYVEIIYNHTFSGLKNLNVLHLENNNLKELKGFEFDRLENLRELYLQNNKIASITNGTFLQLKHLEVLRLDGNRLLDFPVWLFSLNPYLVEIALSENRWSCECKFAREYQVWLTSNFVKVVDADKITCVYNASIPLVYPMSEFNATLCTRYISTTVVEHPVIKDYLPFLLVTVTVFLVVFVVMCMIFYYRNELRVWVYSHCGVRMCYKTTFEEDREKLYDAYISYSVKDENFVLQVLAPELEHGQPSYRLCLHYKDFPVTAYIADTIVEAVESSRRTIIVLSKNFIQSEWCRFEFKSALHEVLKDRKKRLIVILLGDIPQRDLDPDLRLYLKTNTCIPWSDKLFWQKLRFAMPDVRNNQRTVPVSVCSPHFESPHHGRPKLHYPAETQPLPQPLWA